MVIVVDKKSLFMDGFIVERVSCVKGIMTPTYVWYLGSIVQEKGHPIVLMSSKISFFLYPHFKKRSSYHFCIIFSKEQLTAT